MEGIREFNLQFVFIHATTNIELLLNFFTCSIDDSLYYFNLALVM